MKIVMKFRTVEVTTNGVMKSIKLESITDALSFVAVLKKILVKRREDQLPDDYLVKLRNHLEVKGVINKLNFDRKKKVCDRLFLVSSLVEESIGRMNA
ncbi:hypothetical protein F4826_004753 [Rahnella inusitata]|nr:hypothetical protein [Rahnella inusitata]